MFNGLINYKWQFSIAFCMFTRGYYNFRRSSRYPSNPMVVFFVPYEIPILGTSILKKTPNSQIVDDVLYMVPTVHMCKIVYVYIYIYNI